MANTNARLLRDEDPTELDQQLRSELDDVTVGHTKAAQQQTQIQQKKDEKDSTTGDELPAEYRGKTAAELVKIIADKQEMIGRQGQEIGHLRDLSDQLLTVAQTQAPTQAKSESAEPVQVSTDDLLENPTEALTRVIRPMLKELTDELRGDVQSIKRGSVQEQFKSRHPDYEKDMASPDFQKFVQSSRYRSGLAAKAYQNGDFEAAEELFSAWDEQKTALTLDDDDSTAEQQAEQQQQLQDAQTVRGGGAGAGDASKPIFSARKLQDLRNRNPDAYYDPAFQAEVLKAFQEHRVK